ncbi:MAG: hypothetical protein HZB38_17770, partial [Planctomycetes bacterium]|nr:hypothetical protein [Planctomycetota bacterium]
MNIVLFEDEGYINLLPLTWLRPAFELRCGRDRLIDKQQSRLDGRVVRVLVRPELSSAVAERVRTSQPEPRQPWSFVNSRLLVTSVTELPPPGAAWTVRGSLLAATAGADKSAGVQAETLLDARRREEWLRTFRFENPPESVRLIDYPWDLFTHNGTELRAQLTHGGQHEGKVYPGAHLIEPQAIRIASGAVIKPGAVLDASNGAIEIDQNAIVEPNAVIQGPVYVGPNCIVRPTAVIREETSIGPVCRVGGEIEGTVFQGYANKQHDGFLGHSYVASWVNLGADTITSDLKNTYGTIRVQLNGVGVETGRHFLGSIIGDHAKTGIGTILGTGTILGVAANVFTRKSVPKFVPSFGWLTDEGLEPCRVEKIVSIARTVMGRRKVDLSPAEQHAIEQVAAAARQIETMGWTPEGER